MKKFQYHNSIVFTQFCNLLWITPRVTDSIPVTLVFLILIDSPRKTGNRVCFTIIFRTKPRQLTYWLRFQCQYLFLFQNVLLLKWSSTVLFIGNGLFSSNYELLSVLKFNNNFAWRKIVSWGYLIVNVEMIIIYHKFCSQLKWEVVHLFHVRLLFLKNV